MNGQETKSNLNKVLEQKDNLWPFSTNTASKEPNLNLFIKNSLICSVAQVFDQDGDSAFDRVVQDALHLELVLVVGVPLRQVTELLGQVEAVADVFRGHEVLGDLDAVVEIPDLHMENSHIS